MLFPLVPLILGAIAAVRLVPSTSVQILKSKLTAMIQPFGQLKNLNLDPARQTLSLSVHLDGEDRPHTVTLHGLSAQVKDLRLTVSCKKVEADRPWLVKLLENYAVGRSLEVPVSRPAALMLQALLPMILPAKS